MHLRTWKKLARREHAAHKPSHVTCECRVAIRC